MAVRVRSVTAQLKADTSDFNRGLLEAAAAAKTFGRSLDDSLTRVDEKMSNLTATLVSLGPALVPVAAAATVGIAAIGTQLTFAAAGAGVAVLALKGVGEALDALNQFQLDPSQANIDALRAKLDELGTAGQSFVVFLDGLQSKFAHLNNVAEAGFLPGLQAGIESAMHQFPVVNRIVGDLATTMGNLAREGGNAFDSPFWRGFLADFARNASTALQSMAEGLGNVATGFAGMFDAFLPVGASFSQELLRLSQDFSAWGQGLADNQGFKEFIQYVQSTAPEVADTLASIAEAILAILRAAAPVGPVLLPVIKALADGLSAVANSPAGPAIVGAAVAISALAKALALLKAVGIVGAVSSAVAGVGTAAAVEGGAAMSATELAAVGGGAVAVGTVGAGILAATVALAPAVIGFKQAKDAADDLDSAVKNVDNAFGSSVVNLQAQSDSLQGLQDQLSSYQSFIAKAKSEETSTWNPFTIVKDASIVDWNKVFNADDAEAAANKLGLANFQLMLMKDSLGVLRENFGAGFTTDTAKLQNFADRTISAFTQAGHSVDQFWRLVQTSAGQTRIEDIIGSFKSADGAVGGLDDQIRAAQDRLTQSTQNLTLAQEQLNNITSGRLSSVAGLTLQIESARTP